MARQSPQVQECSLFLVPAIGIARECFSLSHAQNDAFHLTDVMVLLAKENAVGWAGCQFIKRDAMNVKSDCTGLNGLPTRERGRHESLAKLKTELIRTEGKLTFGKASEWSLTKYSESNRSLLSLL